MSKTGKGLIAVAITAAIAAGAYFWYKSKSAAPAAGAPSKSDQCKYLVQYGYSAGPPSALMGFGDGFVLAWYNAALQSQAVFAYNGLAYNSSGGTAVTQ